MKSSDAINSFGNFQGRHFVSSLHIHFHFSPFALELSSVDDDWEKDFDIEVSEEDIRLAQEAARKLADEGVNPADEVNLQYL